MRGKHRDGSGLSRHDRITPADAGKTATTEDVQNQFKDHPRGCGENLTVCRIITLRPGSPPRMRGKRKKLLKFSTYTGITPADAGKTWRKAEKDNDTEDHPRGCGENAMLEAELDGNTGSPPRMRGKRSTAGQAA